MMRTGSIERGSTMREVVFRLVAERSGHLEARAESLPIRITAPTLEELQHEAREALIAHLGPAHSTYRLRILRHPGPAAPSGEGPGPHPRRTPALCR
jgi:hypothetical protein